MGLGFHGFNEREGTGKTVLEMARIRTAEVFDRFDTVCVNFSGGKDSTCILNVAVEEAQVRRAHLHVHFSHDEIIPDETVAYVERTRNRLIEEMGERLHWVTWCLPFRWHNASSRREPWWYAWDPRCPEKWVQPMPEYATRDHPMFNKEILEYSFQDFENLTWDPTVHGTVGIILGIRAGESLTRRHAVSTKKVDNWIIVPRAMGFLKMPRIPGVMKCYTIYDWTTEDVWLAPKQLGWDYNEAYDRLDAAGIPPSQQRTGQPTAAESMIDLVRWAECFPDVWQRACDRVPGLRTAAMYADTDLYAHGDVPGPREGETWADVVEREIMRWGEEMRPTVRSRVQFYLRYHYRRVDDPLCEYPHPQTGVSWPMLSKMAQRGDLKFRGRPELISQRMLAQKNPEKWEEALAQWREQEASRSVPSSGSAPTR